MGERDYMKVDWGQGRSGGGGIGDPRSWSAVKMLLVLNLGVFVLQHFIFREGAPFWNEAGLQAGGVSRDALGAGRVWTLVTYMFVHSGFEGGGLAFMHILGNMLVLFFLGRPLESTVGRKWVYLIFFGGGLAGAALELVVTPQTYLIGASAGTMAILLAFTTVDPERRIMMLIPLPVEVKLRTLGRLVLGVSVVLGVISKLSDRSGGMPDLVLNVAHFAHLGGAVFGMLVMRKIRPVRASPFEMSTGDILRGVESGGGKKAGGGFKKWWAGGGKKKKPVVVEPRDKALDEREYDAILDKMNARGKQSLTAEEFRRLGEMSERMKAREKKRDG